MAKHHEMTLESYFDRYGVDVDELAVALMRRLEHLEDERRRELLALLRGQEEGRQLVEQARTVAKGKQAKEQEEPLSMLVLVDEASANLQMAKKLRESVVNSDGSFIGTVADVQRAIQASDRCLQTASKRWTDIYNVSTAMALEEAVKEAIRALGDEVYQAFMEDLEGRLEAIR